MIPMRSAWVRLPAILLTIAAIAGCNVLQPDASGASRPADAVHAQAQDALERWADAAAKSGGSTISFVGDQTGLIGDFEPAVGGNDKMALMAGLFVAATPLSDDRPSRGKVHWIGGDSVDVDVLSAADALDDLIAAAAAGGGECGDCLPLRVTDAHLATGLVETTQGPAEAPLWVFTIEGTAVRITRVAVDPSITVVPPPYNADHPPAGMSFDLAVGSPGSTKLTVSFTGATKPGDQPCGADYAAEAVESDLAVVVIVVAHENPMPASCTAVGKTRTATVTLDAPLGKRAVLEVTQGLPVPVHAP
jgi:hypothetical protein